MKDCIVYDAMVHVYSANTNAILLSTDSPVPIFLEHDERLVSSLLAPKLDQPRKNQSPSHELANSSQLFSREYVVEFIS